jgi:glycosyltransferase involved in cell wall biosynthesis
VYFLPSAADITHFQSTHLTHPSLGNIPHPRLGVCGTFDDRTDSNLLRNITARNPNWHLVLVGKIRPGFKPLPDYTNIHWLGPLPFEQLPSLLNGMDVNLIPYVQGERTAYINPLKFYEYLSVGKPIVSTYLPELEQFQDVVFMSSNVTNFYDNINLALASDDSAKVKSRRQLAQSHSWDARVDKIEDIIKKTINERN